MPRYFFRVIDDADTADDEGADLLILDEAREYASRAITSMMADQIVTKRRLALNHRIEIEDEQRRVLDTVRFGDVVTIET